MFDEFCLPYYRRLCAEGGLWYYGCCEQVHPVWEGRLGSIPNIKKVSISKWCNEKTMGRLLQNTGIVYSRKIDATYTGIAPGIDAEGLAANIRNTMKYAGECQIEFISRDMICTHGNIGNGNLKTAVEIIRHEIAEALGG
jgi:hypothetical protein